MSQHNGAASPTKTVARGMAELAHDVVTLGELQAQLAKAELDAWARSFILPVVLLASGLFITLGSVPVLLLSLAYVLVEQAGWPLSLSLLVAGVVGLAIAGAVAGIGLWRLRKHPALLVESRDQFNRNVNWIKQVLRTQSNPPGRCDPVSGGQIPVI